MLDSYDLNIVERGGGKSLEDAFSYLSQRNPNDLHAPRGSVDLAVGLDGMEKRFLPMGGGIGTTR